MVKIYPDPTLQPDVQCAKEYTAAMRAAEAARCEMWPRHLHCIGGTACACMHPSIHASMSHTHTHTGEITAMGGTLSARTRSGLTALLLAAKAGNAATLKGIHVLGGDINARTRTGSNAFALAAQHGDLRTLDAIYMAFGGGTQVGAKRRHHAPEVSKHLPQTRCALMEGKRRRRHHVSAAPPFPVAHMTHKMYAGDAGRHLRQHGARRGAGAWPS